MGLSTKKHKWGRPPRAMCYAHPDNWIPCASWLQYTINPYGFMTIPPKLGHSLWFLDMAHRVSQRRGFNGNTRIYGPSQLLC